MSQIEQLFASACLLTACAAAGCGSSVPLTQVQEAYQQAEASYRAADGSETAPSYLQARRLFEEAEARYQAGENRLALRLFERSRRYAELAAAQAKEADAQAERDRALAAYLNALIAEGNLKGEAGEARRQLEQALRERAEEDARQARQETQAAQQAADADRAQAEQKTDRLLAEAALAQAAYALQLAAQANAAAHEPTRFENAQRLEAQARQQLAAGDSRRARLQALEAFREADDLRVSARAKQTARRAQESRSAAEASASAARELGAAEALLDAAAAFKTSVPVRYQAAETALKEAQRQYDRGAYEEAQASAASARQLASLAVSEGAALFSAARQTRSAEEQTALVKDMERLLSKRVDKLPEFAKERYKAQLETAAELSALASRLMKASNLNLAARNAEAAAELLGGAESWTRQVQADESALLEAGGKIDGAQVFVSERGVVFRIPDALEDPAALIKKIAEAARSFYKRYHLEAVGHVNRAGNASAEMRKSQESAESVGKALAPALGVPLETLNAIGRGADEPIEGLDPKDARNRRVEIVVRTRGPEKELSDAPSDR